MSVARPLVLLVALTGCAPEDPAAPVDAGPPSATPVLRVVLHDAPADEVDQVWVTIDEVTVHEVDGAWHLLSDEVQTMDLLALQDGVVDELGVAALPTGAYDQIRLRVADAWVVADGSTEPLTVPSGTTTGVKIHHPITIGACGTTTLSLDWDVGAHLRHSPGAGWILRPTVRVDGEEPPASCGARYLVAAGGDPGVMSQLDLQSGDAEVIFDDYLLQAAGVAVDGDGEIYFGMRTDIPTLNYRILRLEADGSTTEITRDGHLRPMAGMAVDPSGDLLAVVGSPSRKLVRIDVDTGTQTVVSSGGYFVAPHYVTVDANGDILVSDADSFGGINSGPGAVIRVDPTTGSQTVVSTGGLFQHPLGIDVEPDGNILVADIDLNRVVRIDPDDGAQSVLTQGGNLSFPSSVRVDAAGAIYVCGGSTQTLVGVDPDTGFQTAVAGPLKCNHMAFLPN